MATVMVQPRKAQKDMDNPPPSGGAPAQCLLLKLPPELRNRIYHLVLRVTNHRGRYTCMRHSSDMKKKFLPKMSVLSLLKTCRQIRQEAATIFYSINEVYFHIPFRGDVSATFASFVRSHRPHCLEALNTVSFARPYWDLELMAYLLRRSVHATNVREVTFHIDAEELDWVLGHFEREIFALNKACKGNRSLRAIRIETYRDGLEHSIHEQGQKLQRRLQSLLESNSKF